MAAPTIDRVPGSSTPRRLAILVVGDWEAMPSHVDTLALELAEFRRTPDDLRSVKRAAGHYEPSWLVVGMGLDEWHVRDIVGSARAVLPHVRLAMLGTLDDLDRHHRWQHRGCQVYVQPDISAPQLVDRLRMSAQERLVVFDQAFQDRERASVEVPLTSLTRREAQVLEQVRRGLRNAEVAKALFVTERTVEYHMTNLLFKLGARHRLEAVERAESLGLL
jgi:DNA-binding NarL/FixJ family response regulator